MLPITFLLNARSGSNQADTADEAIHQIFGERSSLRVVKANSGAEMTAALDEAVKHGTGIVVAGGGDGTVNAVASRVAGTDIVMGVLPLGTLNHFAKDLNIPMRLDDAIRTIAAGNTRSVDVAEVNGRIFVNNSSLGLYPQMVLRRQALQRRGKSKWIAFAGAALEVLRMHPFMHVRVEADGEEIYRRAALVFIGNNQYKLEGLEAGSRGAIVRGRLCLYVTPHQHRLSLARLAMGVGLGDAAAMKEIDSRAPKTVTIQLRKRTVEVAMDGEVVRMRLPLHYSIRPGALNVIVPSPDEQK